MKAKRENTMITAIRPYATQNKQRQNFGVAHQNWVDKLVADPGIINNKFNDAMVFGDISPQDTIDTLTVAKRSVKKGFHESFDELIEWAKKSKDTGVTK